MKFFALFLTLLTADLAGAVSINNAVFPELVTSSRAQAMGNAFLCKVDDAHAAFYNPAGLGTVRMGHFHVTNLHLESNKGMMGAAGGDTVADAPGNVMDILDLDGMRQLLREDSYRNELGYYRVQTMPNILFRFFSAGFFYSSQKLGFVGRDADASTPADFEYHTRTDFGPYGAINISLFGGIFKIGGTFALLRRSEFKGSAPNNQTLNVDSEEKQALMEYVIGGARLTLPWNMLPTFAATIHNATGADWRGADAADRPEEIKQSIDVGFSLTPQIGRVTRLHLEANLKDIGHAYDGIGTDRRLVFGGELDIKRTFFLRFGYGDGYGTAGIGIKSRRVEVDLTTYAVDTETNDLSSREDRRFAFYLSSGF